MTGNLRHQAETVMRVLTRQVRAVSLDQLKRIARSVHGPRTRVAAPINRLLDQGMVDRMSVTVAYPRVREPLVRWQRECPAPDHGHIEWLLHQRWSVLTPEITPVYWATARGECFYGGVAGLLNHSGQLEHDLGAAEVLTVAYQDRHCWAGAWIGEDLLKREYDRLIRGLSVRPDAITRNGRGEIFKAIEFGGQYSIARLRRLHEAFQRQRIRYELW